MDRADQEKKARTKTWLDVVKGLKKEEELETSNSDKSRNKSETFDSVKLYDSDKPNHMTAKRTRGQPKPTPK